MGESAIKPRARVYCDNSRCPLRRFTITFEYLPQPESRQPPSAAPPLFCPRCRKRLLVDAYGPLPPLEADLDE